MSDDGNEKTSLLPLVPPVADDQLVAISQRVDQRVAAWNKIRMVALKATNWRHWSNQGGQPYLEGPGAKAIASFVGINWKIDEPIFEWLDDGHFAYTYTGDFSLGGITQEYIGTRNSKAKWFSEAHKIQIPPSEIDRGEVKKAALTNCLGNGVRGILGMSKLTWDELKTSGIDVEKIASVIYEKGSADPNAAACLPNYDLHDYPGFQTKAVNDPSVPVAALSAYAAGLAKSIADPAKEKYRSKNTLLRQAILNEINERGKATTRPADGAGPTATSVPSQQASDAPGTNPPPMPPALTTDQWIEAIEYLGEDADRNDVLKDVLEAQRYRSCGVVPKDKRRALLVAVQAACAKAKVPCQPLIGE